MIDPICEIAQAITCHQAITQFWRNGMPAPIFVSQQKKVVSEARVLWVVPFEGEEQLRVRLFSVHTGPVDQILDVPEEGLGLALVYPGQYGVEYFQGELSLGIELFEVQNISG